MSRVRNLNDFLALLKGVKRAHDGQYMALCHAHHDTKPSLSVGEADGKILLTCFAGCQLQDILRPLGLTVSDLFLNGSKKKPVNKRQKKLIATFSYEDASGVELYQVRRYKPKDFNIWHKEGGKYVPGLGGVTPVLYRLPQLKEWIEQGKTIYLPEGEGKAERLLALGLAATTAPFGAKHEWLPYYNQYLAGAHVCILADNDNPGKEFAHKKARDLLGVAKSVKFLLLPNLPDHGDVKDWLDDGHTREELKHLVAKCPEYEPPPDATLPEIVVTDRQLRDITADALGTLYSANKPERIFRRSGSLTRISLDEQARTFTETLSESALRGCLARSCNFVRIMAKGY